MPTSLETLRQQRAAFFNPPVTPAQNDPLSAPLSVQLVARTGGFIFNWSPVAGADGYRVAVMTDKNLAAPDRGIYTVAGGTSTRWFYPFGNLTRSFAVQATRGNALSPYSSIFTGSSSAGDLVDDSVTNPLPPPPTSTSDPGGTSDFGNSGWSSITDGE